MELKDQVVSFEFARKLKELGVQQKSLFAWKMGTVQNGGNILIRVPERSTLVQSNLKAEPCLWKSDTWGDHFAAFTVAELGELLPKKVKKDGYYVATIWFGEEASYIEYGDREGHRIPLSPIAGSEADARAKMLIYLIENQLVSL